VIHGEHDIVTATEAVRTLTEKLQHQRSIQIDLEVIDGADHVFNKKLDVLSEAVERYIDREMAEADEEPTTTA
jgi:alpha/beta superfamily hydrolase